MQPYEAEGRGCAQLPAAVATLAAAAAALWAEVRGCVHLLAAVVVVGGICVLQGGHQGLMVL
jgi:hypothetical protein